MRSAANASGVELPQFVFLYIIRYVPGIIRPTWTMCSSTPCENSLLNPTEVLNEFVEIEFFDQNPQLGQVS